MDKKGEGYGSGKRRMSGGSGALCRTAFKLPHHIAVGEQSKKPCSEPGCAVTSGGEKVAVEVDAG